MSATVRVIYIVAELLCIERMRVSSPLLETLQDGFKQHSMATIDNVFSIGREYGKRRKRYCLLSFYLNDALNTLRRCSQSRVPDRLFDIFLSIDS